MIVFLKGNLYFKNSNIALYHKFSDVLFSFNVVSAIQSSKITTKRAITFPYLTRCVYSCLSTQWCKNYGQFADTFRSIIYGTYQS